MVSGIVHWLLPALTLCRSSVSTRMGQDILSDVLRALYFATQTTERYQYEL